MEAKKVSSFLWFKANADEAVKFYASVFGANCSVSGTSFELFDHPSYRTNQQLVDLIQQLAHYE